MQKVFDRSSYCIRHIGTGLRLSIHLASRTFTTMSPKKDKLSAFVAPGVDPARVRLLNKLQTNSDGEYVLYWMQASVRCDFNHALEFAIARANALSKPLACCFGVTDRYPEANDRHYAFMLQGLAEVQEDLKRLRSIHLDVFKLSPQLVAVDLSEGACEVVTDMGYVHIQRTWRSVLAESAKCAVWQVESEAVVPVELASDKDEFAARTLRPKIWAHAKKFLVPLAQLDLANTSQVDLKGRCPAPKLDLSNVPAVLRSLDIDRTVPQVTEFKGGRTAAMSHLRQFIESKLKEYGQGRNEPGASVQSNLSPYLHFGQVSPIEIILSINSTSAPKASKDSFIEELMIRRELAFNFCWFNPKYDSIECLPDWAAKTIREHKKDKRDYLFDLATMEAGKTHDEYWNAAQLEMVVTGKMHNYLRMYWGKKMIEWTADMETAFKWLLHLNNKYELDGRDPNSYAGVAWIFGKHDRAHAERPVFGKLRYMSKDGIKRKFKTAPAYVAKVKRLADAFVKKHGPIGEAKAGGAKIGGAKVGGPKAGGAKVGKARAAAAESASDLEPAAKRPRKA